MNIFMETFNPFISHIVLPFLFDSLVHYYFGLVKIPPLLDFLLQETNPSEELLKSSEEKAFFGVSREIHEAAKAKGYRHTFPMEGQTNETFHYVKSSGIVRISPAFRYKIPHYSFVYFGTDSTMFSLHGKVSDEKAFKKVFESFYFSFSAGGPVALPYKWQANGVFLDAGIYPAYLSISLSTSEHMEKISDMERLSSSQMDLSMRRLLTNPDERFVVQVVQANNPIFSYLRSVKLNLPTLKAVFGADVPLCQVPLLENASLHGRIGIGYERNRYEGAAVIETSLDLRGKWKGYSYSGRFHYDLQRNKPSLKFSLNLI